VPAVEQLREREVGRLLFWLFGVAWWFGRRSIRRWRRRRWRRQLFLSLSARARSAVASRAIGRIVRQPMLGRAKRSSPLVLPFSSRGWGRSRAASRG
jgi:hypothetical protein